MELQVIGTGSKGNAYLLNHSDHRLLLDAGVPMKSILRAMNHQTTNLLAALITHEHLDHGKSAADLAERGIPVFSSLGTAEALKADLIALMPYEFYPIGPWLASPLPVEHDAAEPTGYLLENIETMHQILYLTDTHYVGYNFSGITHLIIECNFVDEILEERLLSGNLDRDRYLRLKRSHLSLKRLKDFLTACDLTSCRKIILIHLSDENSDELQMIWEIEDLTRVETVAAHDGDLIELELYPF